MKHKSLLRTLLLLGALFTAPRWAGAQRVQRATVRSWHSTVVAERWRPKSAALAPLSGTAAAGLQSAPRVDLRPSAERKRLFPYALSGFVAGGVLGYAAWRGRWFGSGRGDDCDMFECAEGPILYVEGGAAIGAGIGLVIGLLRRPRSAAKSPAG
jgi:hypothetical protein